MHSFGVQLYCEIESNEHSIEDGYTFYDAIQWIDILQCMHFITTIYYTILFHYIIKIYA
jgi:hypothetical protein